MSVRPRDVHAKPNTITPMGLTSASTSVTSAGAALQFEQLSETEKSVATMGISPDEWKPIAFMNEAHYGTLLEKNLLGSRLTQQIEAYKAVAQQG